MLCARCASIGTRTAFILRNGRFPISMEEVIAFELLAQVSGDRQGNVPIPVAVIDPDATCPVCKTNLGLKEESA